jgi:hypothetical protein
MAQSNIYLKLDGLDGESLDDDHKDWIEVQNWSWGVDNPASFAVGQGGQATQAHIAAVNVQTTGRSGGTRTPNPRFWRPVLWPIELHSCGLLPSGSAAAFFMHDREPGCKLGLLSRGRPAERRTGSGSRGAPRKNRSRVSPRSVVQRRTEAGNVRLRPGETSAHCGFTNRPTRPAAPLAWPSSLACSSGNVRPGGRSFGSRSVPMIVNV